MNPIDQLFQNLRNNNRKAFIPFVTAGDPDLETTTAVVCELIRRGADLIEIGFPYSDPIADGSVIQASYTRALNNGVRVDQIFEFVRNLQKQPAYTERNVPLVGMVSTTLVGRRGLDRFVAGAKDSGLSGAIVPDLPFEESSELAGVAQAHDFKLIQLVTPTTPTDRAAKIVHRATGFVYCVSVTGITGERTEIPPQLMTQLAELRTQTDLPLCVGFGVSQPEHVTRLREHCDGVIVGSAIVRRLEQCETKTISDVAKEIGDFAQGLISALNPNA